MISSYQFSQRLDPVSILSTALTALCAFLRMLLLLLMAGAALAAAFAVVAAFWLPICQVMGALVITCAFAYVTYPRNKAVNNGR